PHGDVLLHAVQEPLVTATHRQVSPGADRRVSPEGGALAPVPHPGGHLVADQHRADGQAAPQPLGQGDDVGAQVVLLAGQEGAGAAHAGLHLVHDQAQVFFVAEGAHLLHEQGVQGHHAPLALHQLQHDGAGVGVHQLGQAVDVPGGGVDEPLVEGPEVLVEAVLPGGGQGGQGAPVEAVDQGDDGAAALAVVVKAVFAGGLDGALVGLGPRVGEEYLAHAGAAAQGLGQLGAGGGVVEVGGVVQLTSAGRRV